MAVPRNTDKSPNGAVVKGNILDQIVTAKREELKKLKSEIPSRQLEKSQYFSIQSISLEKAITYPGKHGIIAEFKRRSPSRGVINISSRPEEVCYQYLKYGASAVSVLTNNKYFGGSEEDLIKARKECNGPLLRKEFIVDEYQVIESKSLGADAILLIADILSGKEMQDLYIMASSLSLEVLFEVHNSEGIEKLPAGAKIVGINSRNLRNFSVSTDILSETIGMLPEDTLKIAESGIESAEQVIRLKQIGFDGFLIGEFFMKESDPGMACKNFIDDINKSEKSKDMNNS